MLSMINETLHTVDDRLTFHKFDKDSFQDLENKFNYKLKENMFELEYITSGTYILTGLATTASLAISRTNLFIRNLNLARCKMADSTM